MIAASIALAFALYFSAVVAFRSTAGIKWRQRTELTKETILASLAWAAFYYFTHA